MIRPSTTCSRAVSGLPHDAKPLTPMCASLVAILAHTGDATRYDEFNDRFRTAHTARRAALSSSRSRHSSPRLCLKHTRPHHQRRNPHTRRAVSRQRHPGQYLGRELAGPCETNWRRWTLFPKQGCAAWRRIVSLATPELNETCGLFSQPQDRTWVENIEQYLKQLGLG